MSDNGLSAGMAGRVKRATRACNHCRWKRLKCSDQAEGESCMNCRIYGTKCEYTSKWPTQPGKRKERGERSYSVSKSRKKQKYADGKGGGTNIFANVPGGFSPSQSPEESYLETLAAEADDDKSAEVFDATHVTRMDTEIGDDETQKNTQDQDPGTVLIHDKLGKKLVHYLTPMMTGTSEDDILSMSAEDAGLPPRNVTEVLVNAYFDHVGPIYPFIDERSFRKELHQYYQALEHTDRVWLLLVKLVMCVGAAAVRDITDLSQDVKKLREALFSQVTSAAYLIYCHGKLANCQILVLITLYSIQMKKLQGAWLWCRWGIRMQRHYIFRRERPTLIDETQETQTLRDILTWTLFILESQLSLIQFHDDPRLVESMIRQPGDELKKKYPIFCYRLALARISHKVCGVYLDSPPDPLTFCSHIEEMYRAIAAWKDEIPPNFRPETRIFAEDSEYKHVLLMHVEYHTLLLTMFTALGASSRLLNAAKSYKNHPSPTIRNQIAVRITNARRLLLTIGAIADTLDVKPCVGSWLSIVQILNPFSFIYGHIMRRPALTSVQADLHLLFKATGHFSTFIIDTPRNKHIESLITAMYNAAVDAVSTAAADAEEHSKENGTVAIPTPLSATNPPPSQDAFAGPSSYHAPLTHSPDDEYDYSPTIPSASGQQGLGIHHSYTHTPDPASNFAFPHVEQLAQVQSQHINPVTHAPFLSEEEAAAWLASQNQSAMPHMAMMGSGWDEWWWQGGGSNGGGNPGVPPSHAQHGQHGQLRQGHNSAW